MNAQHPAQDVLGGRRERMAQISEQELRESLGEPVERAVLPFSAPKGLKAEAMGSRLYWKTQIRPRRELCVGKE